MANEQLRIENLRDDLPFGSRVFGATVENLADENVSGQIWSAFEERGVLVFEGIEPTVRMHLAVSRVFGVIKEHPDPAVKARTAVDGAPGIVDLVSAPGTDRNIVELEGKPIVNIDALDKTLSGAKGGTTLLGRVRRGDSTRFVPFPVPN